MVGEVELWIISLRETSEPVDATDNIRHVEVVTLGVKPNVVASVQAGAPVGLFR